MDDEEKAPERDPNVSPILHTRFEEIEAYVEELKSRLEKIEAALQPKK